MIFPDKLAVIGIYHPTPNLLKIVENTNGKATGTIFRSSKKWLVEFTTREDISDETSELISSQMTAQYANMGLDARSEFKNGKLYRWGSSKFNEFMNEIASKPGIIIYPNTHWERDELRIIIGVFKGYEMHFSDWITEFVSEAPMGIDLKFYGQNCKNNWNLLFEYLTSITELNLLKYVWKLNESLLKDREFEIFKEKWIGSPKFISDDASKFIIKIGKENGEELMEIDAGESYRNDSKYFLENRYNVLLNVMIKSIGNGVIENQILFAGRIHSSLYKTLNKLWNETGRIGIKHILYNLENVKVDKYNIGSIYSEI